MLSRLIAEELIRGFRRSHKRRYPKRKDVSKIKAVTRYGSIDERPQHARLSLTYDQGGEMSEHALLTAETKIRVYFAHKGCPWERGTNENFNGLVRQFFPKGTDFNKVSNDQINKVQNMLNGRPRRVLN